MVTVLRQSLAQKEAELLASTLEQQAIIIREAAEKDIPLSRVHQLCLMVAESARNIADCITIIAPGREDVF